MACGSGGFPGACHYPNPNDRTPGGQSYLANDPNRARFRRPVFFNRHIHRASAVIQQPSSLTFREAVVVVFTLFALYHAYFAARATHELLFVRRVADACPTKQLALTGCLGFYGRWLVYGILYGWLSQVLPWGVIAAVTVFFGVEIIGRIGSGTTTAKPVRK